jgi:hypothetical protein
MTRRQALMCENSVTGRCRCRCMGVSHGASRSLLPEFFEKLPLADPHRIPERSRQLPLPKPVG